MMMFGMQTGISHGLFSVVQRRKNNGREKENEKRES